MTSSKAVRGALIAIAVAALLTGCSSANSDWVEGRACEKWSRQGFECVDYEGYSFGFGLGSYGGAHVWHRLRKIPDNGITYSGYIQRWGDELHVYGPEPLDGQTLNPGNIPLQVRQ